MSVHVTKSNSKYLLNVSLHVVCRERHTNHARTQDWLEPSATLDNACPSV